MNPLEQMLQMFRQPPPVQGQPLPQSMQPPTREPGGMTENVVDMLLGALGVGPDTRANAGGELMSILLPWAGVPKLGQKLRGVGKDAALQRLQSAPRGPSQYGGVPDQLEFDSVTNVDEPEWFAALRELQGQGFMSPQRKQELAEVLARVKSRQQLDPRQLEATQRGVSADVVKRYVNTPPAEGYRPQVLKSGDKMFLGDGHHRATAQYLREEPVDADVFDIDTLMQWFKQPKDEAGRQLVGPQSLHLNQPLPAQIPHHPAPPVAAPSLGPTFTQRVPIKLQGHLTDKDVLELKARLQAARGK